MSKKVKTIALDFDGVLHEHKTSFTKPEDIAHGPIPGALEFVKAAVVHGFDLIVHTCRAETPNGQRAVAAWLQKHGFPHLEVSYTKPVAGFYIDDRGFQFNGVFPSLDEIENFVPWNKREAPVLVEPSRDLQADIEHVSALCPADRLFVVRELLRREGLTHEFDSATLAIPGSSTALQNHSMLGPQTCWWKPLWLCLQEIPVERYVDLAVDEQRHVCYALPRAPYVPGVILHSAARIFTAGSPVMSPHQENVWWYRLSCTDPRVVGEPNDSLQIQYAGWGQKEAISMIAHIEWLAVPDPRKLQQAGQ